MGKKRGLTTFVILIVFFILNLFLLLNPTSISYETIINVTIKEPPQALTSLNIPLFIFTCITVILITIGLNIVNNSVKKKKKEKLKKLFLKVKKNKKKSETDLDTLYNFLKENKKINIKNLSELFNISPENALEWGKILETHELVTIEYPAFKQPEIKLKEENEETEKGNQEKNKEKTRK